MATLSLSNFILSQNRATGEFTASDWDYNWGLVPQIFNGSPSLYDVAFGNVSVTGNITASGNVTAVKYYGDGSSLTGISSGGATSGVGISQVEMLTETSKQFRTKLPTSLTNIISEPLIDGANFTGTLTAQANSGATIITITPTITGQEPPKLMALTLVKASDGTSEDVWITGGSSGTYTISAGLSQTYVISSPIYRNACSLSTGSANASILSGQTGIFGNVQNHKGNQIDVQSRTNATIDWSVRMNSLTQGLQVSSVVASPTNTISLVSSTDRHLEFSSSSPYNKIIVCKVTEDGQKNVYQIGKGKEFTVTASAYSTTIDLTVADTYNDMDTGNTAATGGVTAAGITALSSDGLTYWIVTAKTAIPKLSFVPTATNESFVEVIPKKATWQQGQFIIFSDNFNRANGAPGNNWTVVADSGTALTINTNMLYAGASYGSIINTSGRIYRNNESIIYQNNYEVTGSMGFYYSGVTYQQGYVYIDLFSTNTNSISNGVMFDGKNNQIRFFKNGANIANASFTWTLTNDLTINYNFKVWYLNGTVYVKVWLISGSEPSSWNTTQSFSGFINNGVYMQVGMQAYSNANSINTTAFDNLIIKKIGQGMTISGTESNKTGQLATFRTDLVQASLTATLPTIESKNLIVSGGI